MKSNALDTIICINVLEHIEDHRRALTNMANGIENNGHICILVPALAGLFGSLDERDNHKRRYSKRESLSLTKGLPVKIIKCYYMNFIGAIGWFVKGKILKQKTQYDIDYRFINLILPIISIAEGFIKPPFGLSLIMILKKIK